MARSLSLMSLDELWELFPVVLKEDNPKWEDWYLQEEKLINKIVGNQYID